jgi:hypothetical protein
MNFRLAISLCLVLTMAILNSGCQKKKSQDKNLAELAGLDTTAAALDTGDMFEEFLEDSAEKVPPPKKAVKSQKTKKETYSSGSSAAFSEQGRYVIQVSCVASQNLAKRQASDFTAKGWPAYVAEVANPTPDMTGIYYRVRIGGFTSISAAKQFGESELYQAGLEYWIDNRSNDNIGMDGSGLGQGSAREYSAPAAPATPAAIAPEPELEPVLTPAQPIVSSPVSSPASTRMELQPSPAATMPELEHIPSSAAVKPSAQSAPAAEPAKAPAADDWEENDDW